MEEEKASSQIRERLEKENHLIAERIRKLEQIKEKYSLPYRFEKKHSNAGLQEKYSSLKPQEHSGDIAVTAGRITGLRRMGKITFMHLVDNDEKIQLYFSNQEFSNYDDLKLLDMGDILGVRGSVFKTKTGELTIKVLELEILG